MPLHISIMRSALSASCWLTPYIAGFGRALRFAISISPFAACHHQSREAIPG
nr:MAG TPA: hypothetical protein [Caudoviricetes sp.]